MCWCGARSDQVKLVRPCNPGILKEGAAWDPISFTPRLWNQPTVVETLRPPCLKKKKKSPVFGKYFNKYFNTLQTYFQANGQLCIHLSSGTPLFLEESLKVTLFTLLVSLMMMIRTTKPSVTCCEHCSKHFVQINLSTLTIL